MGLPESDQHYLRDRELTHAIAVEGGMTCVVFTAWGLPPGFNCASSDLLIRLPGGYPDVPPDMWWFSPAILMASGQQVVATEAVEHYLGRSWQRWSRHLSSGQWQSGIDGLESYLALINRELARSVPVAA